MKILTGNEAFAAMAAGQKIECRHAESNLDFDDIRDFPATVFIDTAYEFRIAVIYMTIGKMSLPEAIKEAPAKGTQCFVPSVLTEKLSKSFKWKNSDADLAFMQRGLVHLYEQNAVRHAAALIAVGGGAVPAGNDTEAAGLAKADDSLPWEDPAEAEKPQAVPADQDNATPSNHAAKKTFENSEAHGAAEIETDPVKLVEKFTAQINACTQAEPVLTLRYTFSANSHLEREHVQHLHRLTELKLEELDPEAYKPAAPSPAPAPADLNVKELQRLQAKAEQQVEDVKQKAVLDDLLERAAAAKTPAEATALTGYTKSWTEEQRKPLVEAIHKRLNELNPSEAAEAEKPPMLLNQIENATDLTELNRLEIEVAGRHVGVQPMFMRAVNKRRAELENQAGEEAS
ncbi:MAG: hypothetical protein JNJ93_02515 [Acinetobacter sp.]|nr:hypothetical protein [Acinetobacter sp.]